MIKMHTEALEGIPHILEKLQPTLNAFRRLAEIGEESDPDLSKHLARPHTAKSSGEILEALHSLPQP